MDLMGLKIDKIMGCNGTATKNPSVTSIDALLSVIAIRESFPRKKDGAIIVSFGGRGMVARWL